MLHAMHTLREIGARYSLAAIYVFGSRAAEVARRFAGDDSPPVSPESDVDIGVQPASGLRLTARDRVRLTEEIENLFGVRTVDLIILPEADPFLALDVIRGELLYCTDKDAQAEEELYILRRAADLAPFARERWKQILTGSAS